MSAYSDYRATLNPLSVWRMKEAASPLRDSVTTLTASKVGAGAVIYQAPSLLSADPDPSLSATGNTFVSTLAAVPNGEVKASEVKTIEGWVNFTAFDTNGIGVVWGVRDSDSLASCNLQIVREGVTNTARIDSRWRFGGVSYSKASTDPILNFNTPYHLIATNNRLVGGANVTKLYVNAVPVSDAGTPSGFGIGGAGRIYMGGNVSAGWNLIGGLDELAAYPTVLTPAEVTKLYVTGSNTISWSRIPALGGGLGF